MATGSFDDGVFKVALTAGTTTTGGDVLSLANPEGVDLIIPSGGFVLDITTAATGAANADAGIAADGTTSSDTLIDGCDVGTAAAVFDNGVDAGTNGGAVKWGSSQYITVTPSATCAGLVGYAYIKWIRE
jgi:hypothetical protein